VVAIDRFGAPIRFIVPSATLAPKGNLRRRGSGTDAHRGVCDHHTSRTRQCSYSTTISTRWNSFSSV
jgi:hypothetical protein